MAFALNMRAADLVRFTVSGPPVPKGRPRTRVVTARGKAPFAHIYSPPKTEAYEKEVARIARAQMAGRSPTDRPVAVSMLAVFPIPKSITKAKLAGIQAGFIPCQASADLDNVFKSVADAMNKIVFIDDSQVVQMTAKKLYGEEPRVVVSVREFLPADLLGD